MCDLFGRAYRSRTAVLMCCWVSGIVSYYALQLNAQSLAGNIFTNFLVSSFVDAPAIATVYFLVDILGKEISRLCYRIYSGGGGELDSHCPLCYAT